MLCTGQVQGLYKACGYVCSKYLSYGFATLLLPTMSSPIDRKDLDSMNSSTDTMAPATHPAARSAFATGLRRRILHITPGWFAINMGTGISSILLHNLPYNAPWLRILASCIFVLNVVVFMILASMTMLRYIVWPRTFMVTLDHPLQSLFWGTLPMGLATIVNMTVFVCVPSFGSR